MAALGMLLASDQAVAVGVGSLPTPATDVDSDLWMMHDAIATATGTDSAGLEWRQGFETHAIDSKAMRKMAVGQTHCTIIENISTVGLDFYLYFSVFFKVA